MKGKKDCLLCKCGRKPKIIQGLAFGILVTCGNCNIDIEASSQNKAINEWNKMQIESTLSGGAANGGR